MLYKAIPPPVAALSKEIHLLPLPEMRNGEEFVIPSESSIILKKLTFIMFNTKVQEDLARKKIEL